VDLDIHDRSRLANQQLIHLAGCKPGHIGLSYAEDLISRTDAGPIRGRIALRGYDR